MADCKGPREMMNKELVEALNKVVGYIDDAERAMRDARHADADGDFPADCRRSISDPLAEAWHAVVEQWREARRP